VTDSPRGGRVVVTGSVAFDYLMRFPGRFVEHLIPDRLQRLSVSFLVDEMRRVPGGCASNIAYGLALLGETPLLFATAGHDAAEYRRALADAGVDVSGLVLHPDVFTASFFVSTDEDQNQIASFYTGAMSRAGQLSIADTGDGPESLVIVSPNDPSAMVRYPEECRSLGIPFLYDPSQQVARLGGAELREGLEGAWGLIVNDYELGIVIQKTGLASEELEGRVPVLVVTHGADGSSISVDGGSSGRRRFAIPAAPLEKKAVDPTGVGDAYRAGLVRGRRLGLDWEVAGRMGSVAAAMGLEALGPQPPPYTIEDFIGRYERGFGEERRIRVLRDRAD
jgi:adenosine kinase